MSPGQSATSRTARALACAAALAALMAAPASGQSANGGFRIAFAGGPTVNDLETGGVDWIFVGGVEWRPHTWPMIVLADVRYLTYSLAEREHLIMPELGLQFQASLGAFRPFVGLGGGLQYNRPHGSSSFTSHLDLGARIRLSRLLDLRFEARGRTVDPAIGLTAGFSFAL